MYRKGSFDEMLAKDLLKSKEARKSFLLADVEEEDFNAVESLKTAINSMGIKDFANLAELPTASVSRFINGDEIPKFSTLEKFFAPFGVKPKLEIEQVA
jgi:DNA-binding phage protein